MRVCTACTYTKGFKLQTHLKLKETTIELVDGDNRLDPLSESLAKHSLSLNGNTLDTVDNNEGTVSDTKSGSNLSGEVNVTRGVNQVDKELAALQNKKNSEIAQARGHQN